MRVIPETCESARSTHNVGMSIAPATARWIAAFAFCCTAYAAPALAAEPEGFLVAPFQNESNVKSLDWMASSLAITVAEKLEAVGRLRPVYGPGVLDGWETRMEEPKA